jgi:LPS sulfotransferase NodH
MILAPLGVSVYTRITHFKVTIEALQKNTLACHTNLIIYSDAASNEADVDLVSKVRLYAKSIQGFRTVTVIERPHNLGGVDNALQAVSQLVRIFKKTIFVEDDIETAPGFLAFMNSALDFYYDTPSVTSISGYSPPLNIAGHIDSDFYVMNRFCGWGSGLYERTVELLNKEISQADFDSLEDENLLCEFGDDVLNMVKKEIEGSLDAGDVRCMFWQTVYNTSTIYPRFSLVQNNGHDGTGYHCGITKRFNHDSLWGKTDNFVFIPHPIVNDYVKKEQQDFRAFRGDYNIHRPIYNQTQCKEIALNYISDVFNKDISNLIVSGHGNKPKSIKVAILSTPRVGSTLLSYLLNPYFGESIRREWLHKKFVEAFDEKKQKDSIIAYLDFLKNEAFSDCNALGLHFHVNQVITWKQDFGIDIFHYFDFDQVIYMERKDMFAQSFSLAVATESGLWGSEIINALNIAPNFKVQVSEKAFNQAYKTLSQEKEYYEKHLKHFITHNIEYEDLMQDLQKNIVNIFEIKLKLTPQVSNPDMINPEKCVSIVCNENREELKCVYNENFSNESKQ